MTNLLFLDIETTGLNPWYGNKITCICAKVVDSETKKEIDCFKVASNDEPNLLNEFGKWSTYKIFTGIGLPSLVTKNGISFDIPFILARDYLTSGSVSIALLKLNHFDLHTITQKWVSLDDMAAILKCKRKKGNGLNAIKLFKEGRLDELMEYCWNDVLVTEEVYFKYMELK